MSSDAAISAISDALRNPTVFNFDPLFRQNAVVALKGHELFSLLQIFANDDLLEFQAWMESHPGVVENYDLDKSQLERKIRLLSICTLGSKYIGKDLPYSKISEKLQIDVSQVESWIIDVIRTGLLSGKMSQTTQSIHVVRCTSRVFEKEQWEALEKRVLAWRTSLAGVMEVVESAKRVVVA
ncbi:hypothetical protein F5887DRAFT_992983 [Amanita rubescens]|nr:hypothetical protein F5887DRAFT_992983 [Amanita rubescens]